MNKQILTLQPVELLQSSSIEEKSTDYLWIKATESKKDESLKENIGFLLSIPEVMVKPKLDLNQYSFIGSTSLESFIQPINTSAATLILNPLESGFRMMELLYTTGNSSTALRKQIGDALTEFNDLVSYSSLESENDEVNPEFKEKIAKWFIRYNECATEIINTFISDHLNDDALNVELLSFIGDVNNASSFRERASLLCNYLQSKNPKLRYGAIIGISNTNSLQLKSNLEDALKKETLPILKNTIKAILEQITE